MVNYIAKSFFMSKGYLNIVALIAVLVVNFLANWLPINNQNTGEVSANYPVLFTPAGYVFGIWGLIYLLLFGFIIYQALAQNQDKAIIQSIGYWFAINSLLNIAWIFAWHYQLIPLSLGIMIGLLLTLIIIYSNINRHKDLADLTEKAFVLFPFSIYLGWICVATIANISVVLYDSDLLSGDIGEVIWTVGMIFFGTVLAGVMTTKKDDMVFAMVFVWAFIGIGVRHGSQELLVTGTALLAATAIILFIIYSKLQLKRRYSRGF